MDKTSRSNMLTGQKSLDDPNREENQNLNQNQGGETNSSTSGNNTGSVVTAACDIDASMCRSLPLEYSASSIQRNLVALTDHEEPKRNLPVSCHVGYIHKGIFVIYHLEGDKSNIANYTHKQSIHLNELLRMSHSHSNSNSSSGGGGGFGGGGGTGVSNKVSKATVILQAKWLDTLQGNVLLLGSINGIYFYCEDGSKLIGKFENGLGLTGYSRACSSMGNSIVAGTDSGDIICFEFDPSNGVVNFTYTKEKLHLSAIQDMGKYQQYLASGDSSGGIKVWRLPDFSIVSDFLAADDCVTGLILSGTHVIGCYASGLVRIYDMKSKDIQVMIKAHSRWIVAMDINFKHSLLLTVSEDNTARVWRIREKTNEKPITLKEMSTQPKLHSSVTVKNQVLVGGCFIDSSGQTFALTSYAEKQLAVYSIQL